MKLRFSEQGTGPAVALLHGLFGAGRNLGVVQRRLAPEFRVLALDLRNHGESPHAAGMSYAEMAEDVAETLAEAGALPAALIGHSMGGKVAMRLALDQPDAVTRLAVMDIAPVPNPPHFHNMAQAMLRMQLHAGMTRAEADATLAPVVSDASLRAFLLQNLRLGAHPAWRIGLQQITASLPVIEGWETPPGAPFTKPVLFVAGARSDYIQQSHRPAIRALFPGARFVTIKDAGHWLHADNPAAVIAVLESFLHPYRAEERHV